MTCWRRLRDWQVAGVWELIHFAPSGSALEVGVPRTLFDVRVVSNFFRATPISANAKTPFPYIVSRDGQRFLVTTDTSQQATEPPITVVENWTAGLKK